MNNKGGYVYLLCDLDKEKTYKIGVTRGDINKRIKKLQTGNSGEIHLVNYHKSEAPFFVEKHLHHYYNKTNIRNEWFLLTDEEAMEFKNNCLKIEEKTFNSKIFSILGIIKFLLKNVSCPVETACLLNHSSGINPSLFQRYNCP